MNFWGFLIGLIIGFFPVFLLLKAFRGKLLFAENIYIKGALWGFLLWVIINVFLYIDASYDLFGLLKGEEGFSTMVIITSSLQGFITAGLLAAFLTKKIAKKKPSARS